MAKNIDSKTKTEECIKQLSQGNVRVETLLYDLCTLRTTLPQNEKSFFLAMDKYDLNGENILKLYNYCCNDELDNLVITLRLFHNDVFSKEQVAKNLEKNSPISFIDPAILLKKEVYSQDNDSVLDEIEFEKWSKKQKESFSKRLFEEELGEE